MQPISRHRVFKMYHSCLQIYSCYFACLLKLLKNKYNAAAVSLDHIITDSEKLIGPRREKTCLRGFRQSEIQTSHLSYRDNLENWNFTCSQFSFQKANNKGADQTARMRRLICACVVRKPPKTGFLATRPN